MSTTNPAPITVRDNRGADHEVSVDASTDRVIATTCGRRIGEPQATIPTYVVEISCRDCLRAGAREVRS